LAETSVGNSKIARKRLEGKTLFLREVGLGGENEEVEGEGNGVAEKPTKIGFSLESNGLSRLDRTKVYA
jgi:hypothetical protein